MTRAPAQPEEFAEKANASTRIVSEDKQRQAVFPSYFVLFSLFPRAFRHLVGCSLINAHFVFPPNLASFHLHKRVA